MGFLRSSIEVRSRHRRCREHWRPHLERTRSLILESARRTEGKRRALLFGAGLLHDIPLGELSAMFEEVLLADIVHTWHCRLAAAKFPNVRLVAVDVTGVVEELRSVQKDATRPLPASVPRCFLDDPILDFTASVNILSQLSWVPGHFLRGRRTEQEIQNMKEHLVRAHLDYLCRLSGHVALITDVSWQAVPTQGMGGAKSRPCSVPGTDAPAGEWDVLGGVVLPRADQDWEWRIAPAPERSADLDYSARVQAYADWKGAGWVGVSTSK